MATLRLLLLLLLLGCGVAQSSKLVRVNSLLFTREDKEDKEACSAGEARKSSTSFPLMHIQYKCSPFRKNNLTWLSTMLEPIKGDIHRYLAITRVATTKEDADVSLSAKSGNYIINLGVGSDISWITFKFLSCSFHRRPIFSLSFVSQTANPFDKIFSYCLPSSASTGCLELGKGALSSPGLQFTPLLSNAASPSFYYVSVGEDRVSVLAIEQSSGKGTIIDSGTTITHLVGPAYGSVTCRLKNRPPDYKRIHFHAAYKRVYFHFHFILTWAIPFEVFHMCFNNFSGDVKVPPITLHFDNNVDVALKQGSVVCLAFAPPPEGSSVSIISIIGSYQQHNFRVVYDISGSPLGIARQNYDG